MRAPTIENLASDLSFLPDYNVTVEFAYYGVRIAPGSRTALRVMREVMESQRVIEELSQTEFPPVDYS